MSEAPGQSKRRGAARAIIAVFGVAFAGVGVVVFGSVPNVPNGFAPCHGTMCVACIQPTTPQCVILARCGGEPCPPDIGGVDPYAGAQGALARGLRDLANSGAVTTFHTDVVTFAGGNPTACATVLYMDPYQRASWLRSVDATAGGSAVVDCRFVSAPAGFKRGGSARRSILSSAIPANGLGEEDPDSTVPLLDAGPEPLQNRAANGGPKDTGR
jgi:hypothetical protein